MDAQHMADRVAVAGQDFPCSGGYVRAFVQHVSGRDDALPSLFFSETRRERVGAVPVVHNN